MPREVPTIYWLCIFLQNDFVDIGRLVSGTQAVKAVNCRRGRCGVSPWGRDFSRWEVDRRGCVFAPVSDQIEQSCTLDVRDSADAMQVLRRLVAQIERAESVGVRLTPEHELFHAAKQTLTVASAGRAGAHSLSAAVRDLVWRVDCVRSVLSYPVMMPSLSEAVDFLDTSDVHHLLRQEP
jgi:hypothetical protein